MRNIINRTRSRDGQVTIVQNGVIIHVGQGLAVQVERERLTIRNSDILCHIPSQLDGRVVSGILDRIGNIGKRTTGDGEFIICAIYVTVERAARNRYGNIFCNILSRFVLNSIYFVKCMAICSSL